MKKLFILFSILFILGLNGLSFARGGGGCFLLGTLISTADGNKAIEDVSIGDQILSFSNFSPQSIEISKVLQIYEVQRDYFYLIKTENGEVQVTAEHPFYVGNSEFKEVADLNKEDFIYILQNGKLKTTQILDIIRINQTVTAYNLQVNAPNTFFANGFAVHNKGGGGGGGGGGGFHGSSLGSSGSGSGSSDPAFAIFFVVILGIIIFANLSGKGAGKSNAEWSSTTSVPIDKVTEKAKKTSALMAFLSQQNLIWDEKKILETAKSTFLKLQECWGKRDYAEMQPLMMSTLYSEHVAQLASMRASHEINKLEELKLLKMGIVNIKNYNNKDWDEFVVWLQAQAKDVIIDDRTGNKIRGDEGTGQFEEFWTFQRQGDKWKLRLIDQPEEGMNIIGEENYDEMMTPTMMAQIYERAGATKKDTKVEATREQLEGAAATGIGDVKSRSQKIHRLLNFLVENDKIWKESVMKDTVREYFILVNTAIEQRKIDSVKDKLTPELYTRLEERVNKLINDKQIIRKGNLTVRNVEIALVRNFYNKKKDEFTAWVSGQAQEVVIDEKTERTLSGDSYVKDFEEFWTFKRDGDNWLLKAMDKGFKAEEFMKQENIDEGSGKDLMEWYYKKDRTV